MIFESEKLEILFFNKIKVSNQGCWEWTGCVDKDGYGKMFYNKKHLRAHRFSYTLFTNEKISPKDFICHKCDNPRCVNIHHLFKGDAKLNMIDKVVKGRLRNQYSSGLCKNGHKMDETRIELSGRYRCKICYTIQYKRSIAKKHPNGACAKWIKDNESIL